MKEVIGKARFVVTTLLTLTLSTQMLILPTIAHASDYSIEGSEQSEDIFSDIPLDENSKKIVQSYVQFQSKILGDKGAIATTKASWESYNKAHRASLKEKLTTIGQFVGYLHLTKNLYEVVPFKTHIPLFQEAKKEREALEKYIMTLDNNEHKLFMILSFTTNVYLPLRDLAAMYWKENSFSNDNEKNSKKSSGLASLYLNLITPVIHQNFVNEDIIPELEKRLGIRLIAEGSNYKITLNAQQRLSRDIVSSLMIPSKENYLKAAQLVTINMMLAQMNLYKSHLGDSTPVHMPPQCSSSYLGASLPSKINFNVPSYEVRMRHIQTLLMKNGLIAGTDAYRSYYKDFVNVDLKTGNVSAIIPFETYTSAKQSLQNNDESAIDDQIDIQAILGIKLSNFQSRIQNDKTCKEAPTSVACKINSQAYALVQDIFNIALEPWVIGEGLDEKTVSTEGLNAYIVNKMKKNNRHYYEDVISKSIIAKLSNNVITVPFPANGIKDNLKRWAYDALGSFFTAQLALPNSKAQSILMNHCKVHAHSPICIKPIYTRLPLRNNISQGFFSTDRVVTLNKDSHTPTFNEILTNGLNLFGEFVDSHEYLPRVNSDYSKINRASRELSDLWNKLQEGGFLPSSRVTEWQYTKGQLDSGNPWAAFKVSYEMMQEDRSIPANVKQLANYILSPLGLYRTFTPNLSNTILTKDEKRSILNARIAQINEESGSLFATKTLSLVRSTFANKEHYEIIKTTANSNLFSKASITSFTANLPAVVERKTLATELESVTNSPEFAQADLLKKIYEARGNLKTQSQIASTLLQQHGLESGSDIKLAFLDLENRIKNPIYKHTIMSASKMRLEELKELLPELCSIDPDASVEDLQQLFYMTSRAQAEMAQVEMPAELEKLSTAMTSKDISSMKTGLLSAGLFVGAIVLSGGLAMPIAAGILATGSVGLQMTSFNTEVDHHVDSINRTEKLQLFAASGFLEAEKATALKHSIGWSALEAAFIIPMVGEVGRILQTSTRALSKSVVKSQAKVAKKALIQDAASETHSLYAKYLLGFEKIEANVLKHGVKRLSKELFKSVVIKESPALINAQFAKTLTDFFFHSPAQMKKFFAKYSDKKLLAATATVNRYKVFENPENLTLLKKIWGKTYPKFKMWQLKAYVENGSLLSKIVTDLAKIEALPRGQGKILENYIAKHADEISLVLETLPFAKREMPYSMLWVGSPALSSRIPFLGKGLASLPMLGGLYERVVLKRLSSARSLLVYESIKESQRQILGLSSKVKTYTTYKLVEAFQNSAQEFILAGDEASASKAATALKNFNDTLAQTVLEEAKGNKQFARLKLETMDIEDFKRTLFAPANAIERAQGELILERISMEKILNNEIAKKNTLSVVQSLSNYSNLDEFQRFVNALKILTVSEKPELFGIL